MTEQTSKRWKAAQLVGAVVLSLGLVLLVVAPPIGIIVTVCGLCLFYAGRFGAWWHHG